MTSSAFVPATCTADTGVGVYCKENLDRHLPTVLGPSETFVLYDSIMKQGGTKD